MWPFTETFVTWMTQMVAKHKKMQLLRQDSMNSKWNQKLNIFDWIYSMFFETNSNTSSSSEKKIYKKSRNKFFVWIWIRFIIRNTIFIYSVRIHLHTCMINEIMKIWMELMAFRFIFGHIRCLFDSMNTVHSFPVCLTSDFGHILTFT